MKIHRSFVSYVAAAALGASLLAAAGAVQARDVSWSVGISSPGVQLGVSNGAFGRHGAVVVQAPVYYNSQPQVYYNQPQVYYSQPQVVYNQPVYSQPQVIYSQPQVIYQTQPYYVQSTWATPVYRPGWGPQYHGRHGDNRRGFNDGRFRDGRR